MSLAQGKYCNIKHLDPEDPRCAHIILTGTIVKLEAGSKEEAFAKKALFSRHAEMPDWPKGNLLKCINLTMFSMTCLTFNFICYCPVIFWLKNEIDMCTFSQNYFLHSRSRLLFRQTRHRQHFGPRFFRRSKDGQAGRLL